MCDRALNTSAALTKQANTCSKLTIETLEKGAKYVQTNKKDTRTTLITSFWCLYCYFEHISHHFLVFLLLILNQ